MSLSNSNLYKKLKRIVDNSLKLDLDPLMKEVQSLHLGRITRSLSVKRLSARKIAEACLQDQSYRSRLVELSMQCTRQYNMLSSAYEAAMSGLSLKLAPKLSENGYKTKQERQSYVSVQLEFAQDRISDLSNAIDIISMVIEDIDKSAWALKLTLNALEINSKPEVSV